jgi:hypothetical protein
MSKQEIKTGKHSPFTVDDLAQAFGKDAQPVGMVTRTAQGRYIYGRPRRAQAQSVGDITALRAKVILQEVFGTERAIPLLSSCFTPKPMPKLVQTFYVASQGSAHRKLAKGQEADLNLNNYLRVDMELWLNAAHVAQFYEDVMETDVDIMTVSTDDAGGALAYAKNLDCADCLANATATQTSGSNWTTQTGTPAYSEYNPITDISNAIIELTAGQAVNMRIKAVPSIVAMNPLVWAGFITNSHISTLVRAGLIATPMPGQLGPLQIPALPNLNVLLDGDLPTTIAYVLDPHYCLMGQGPTQSIGYQNDLKRVEGHVLYEYLQPLLVQDQSQSVTIGARQITGVHS